MSLETDLLLDRRRLKRRLNFWRVTTVAAVAAIGLMVAHPHGVMPGRHIARVRITGLIGDEHKLVEKIDHAAKDPNVAAMIVEIDSPGGAVGGGVSLHDAIARVAAKKPVAAVMEDVAASAGYMVALPAQRIFANPATLTGSIGVLLEAPEFSGLMNKIGVQATTLVSGPLKDQPSLTHPLSPEGRQVVQGLVDDLFGQFVDMVAQARHMDPAKVRSLADGRAYTGHQALGLGLIDAYGGEPDAKLWLEKTKHVPHDLPVTNLQTGGWRQRLFGAQGFSGWLATTLHASLTGTFAAESGANEPMAIWSPR